MAERAKGSKSTDKGGSSAATTELRIVDLEDGKEWIIEDKVVIGLLKEYKSAPDQRTKDDILKRLEKRVASLNPEAVASQTKKNLPKGGATGGGKLMDAAKRSSNQESTSNPKGSLVKIEEREGKLTVDLQNLNLGGTDSQAGKAKEAGKSTRKK